MRRIPYIDPVDLRYRRFETFPKPVAQAVMFCLMDVSGSMSEHMDLAKRFYMLLYVFLTRRYRHVEIVFIRHTHRAEEVDEETFFRSPATGGTVVSTALEEMRRGRRALPAGGLEHLRGAGVRRRQFQLRRSRDGALSLRAGDPAGHSISPMSSSARRGDNEGPGADDAVEHLRAAVRARASAGDAREQRRDIFPVFRDLFRPRHEGKMAAL